ncbi:hypothetical protein, partial [Brevibacillus agri]|uniref:hypothetical protein n=1 Tax=Brevibacillus agri TaxID=51101 RepID=UPI003D21F229
MCKEADYLMKDKVLKADGALLALPRRGGRYGCLHAPDENGDEQAAFFLAGMGPDEGPLGQQAGVG